MSEPLPISVVVVARNEADALRRCLRSVADWTAESIVALNQTTDNSAELARSLGAVVREIPWQGYRDTKNAACQWAGQPWILSLDADEEISSRLRDEIQALFASAELARVSGAQFPRKVWFMNRWITHGDWYPDRSLRLVRKDQARWVGDAFVHERLECDGAVATLDADLYHYSFPTVAHHVGKMIPFADLFVKQQVTAGRRFSVAAAVFRPGWRFVRAYVFRRGFLDGFAGFYIAVATAFGVLVRQARWYEAERGPTASPAQAGEPEASAQHRSP